MKTTLKLGKLPVHDDPRTLRAAIYMLGLPKAPSSQDWGAKVKSWPMMVNDRLGDCTCAAAGHLVQAWTADAAVQLIVTDQQVVDFYTLVSGYDPKDPTTDRGAIELIVLNYWKQFGIGGHKIAGYAKVNQRNQLEAQQCIFLFGGLYIGLGLPLSAQEQIGGVWSVSHDPKKALHGSWGGHAVPIVAYDKNTFTCVTWGKLQKMTWEFFYTYCDEAYALLTQDFITKEGKSPSGFNLEALQADLAIVT